MIQSTMRGKICLVTGANSGIGKATATGLAQLGATVILVCRDRAKGEAALTDIQNSSRSDDVALLLADLSSQASIHQLAHTVQDTYPQLHVLINNAGLALWKRSVSVDGIEMTFAVNYLSVFLLTNLLLERLKASAPARIINVASAQHHPLDFSDLQHEKRYHAMQVYGQSKFAVILFTYELARRLQGSGVTVNCLSPGVVATKLSRDMPLPFRIMTQIFFRSPEEGARTSLYLASSPEVETITGTYFDQCKPAKASPKTNDRAASQRLWEVSTDLVHLTSVTPSQST
jgi:NAD(P)-dependent dehydrogenase (short-subunit alcohol dehydrogenase family)